MSDPLCCWADGPAHLDRDGRLVGSTCLLPEGHEADGIAHEWTSDDAITVRLVAEVGR